MPWAEISIRVPCIKILVDHRKSMPLKSDSHRTTTTQVRMINNPQRYLPDPLLSYLLFRRNLLSCP